MEWTCFYCDKGKVSELLAKCPECGEQLTKPADQLTADEAQAAVQKKWGEEPKCSLAS